MIEVFVTAVFIAVCAGIAVWKFFEIVLNS
jgi:hypothetical protein